MAYAVALLFSVGAAAHSYWFGKIFPDELQYWALTQNLVQTGSLSVDGIRPSGVWPPLLAWLLAPIAGLGLPFTAARISMVVFYLASGLLTAGFLRRLLPDRPSLAPIGTALVLANPIYFFAAGNIYPQLVLAPLFIVALRVTWFNPRSVAGETRRAMGLGALLGVSLLAAASSLFSFLPLLAMLALEDLRSLRRGAAWQAHRAALACVIAALVIAPHMYRNHVNVHPGAYLTLNSGLNLLLGNSPTTTPSSGVKTGVPDPFAAGQGDSEFARNKFYSETARNNLRSEPQRYAGLYVRKLIHGFSNTVDTATHGRSNVQTALLWAYMIVVWIGVCLVIIRGRGISTTDALGEPRSLVLLALIVLTCYVANIAGYAVYFTRLRFRLPMDVALALVSAVGWYLQFSRSRKAVTHVR